MFLKSRYSLLAVNVQVKFVSFSNVDTDVNYLKLSLLLIDSSILIEEVQNKSDSFIAQYI